MNAKSNLEQAALAATGVEKLSKEDDQQYLRRIVVAISKLGDAEWDALPEKLQDWYNEAAEANNNKRPIALLTPAEEAEAEAEAPVKPRGKSSSAEVKEQAAAKDEPKPKAEKEKPKAEKEEPKAKDKDWPDKGEAPRAPKPKSITQRMREVICEHIDASKDEVGKILKEEGFDYSASTLDIMFADTQKTIKVLRELKKMK